MKSSRGRRFLLAVTALVGAAGGLLAVSLMPAAQHRVGPAVMSTAARPGGGHTVLSFPPLGTVRAATHGVPISVEVAMAELDISAVQDLIRNPEAQQETRAAIEDDLRAAAAEFAVRAIVAALIGGAVAGAVVPWRRWSDVGAGAVGGLVVGVAAVSSVALTFDVTAFEEPKFSGALTRAPAVLQTLENQDLSLSAVGSRFDTAAARLSELLKLVATPSADPQEDTVKLLHVSDIHSNPLGIDVARELAEQFDVDAIVDSGDLTSFGEATETNIARRIAAFDVPYIFVPGNHDSTANRERLDEIENVTLLHDDTYDVKGITIFGWRDPTYTVWDAISTEEGNEMRIEEGEVVAERLDSLATIDVLVVHDRRMAEASEGLVPLVLSGHGHERDTTRGEDTDFLSVGSTGATGLEFFVEGDRPYEAEIVYFRDDSPVAVDYVTFGALGEEFEIDRQRLDR